MELIDKEVRYDLYCDKCVHFDLGEEQDPCHDCLNQGSNEYSHKPVYFKAKEGYEGWLPPGPEKSIEVAE